MDSPAPPSLSQVVPGLKSITGPTFLGLVFNLILFGVLSTQVYIYYQAFRNDKVFLRIMVYGVYLLEAAQSILLIQQGWETYAAQFDNVNFFDDIGTAWFSVGIIGGIVAFVVQSFYSYRILVLSRNRIIAFVIIFMSISSYAGSLASSIFLAKTKFYSQFLDPGLEQKIFGLFGLWQSAGTVSDVLIAVCMTYYLRKLSRGSLLPTQRVVDRLLRLTVETGTVTATMSIISIAVFYPFTEFQYYQVPLAAMAKLYSNTMLVAVNSRMAFKVVSESTTWKDVAVVSLNVAPSEEDSEKGISPPGHPMPRPTAPLESMVFEPSENTSVDNGRFIK